MTTVTYSEQEQKQIQMFGCTSADLRKSIEDSITFKLTGPAMVAMGMMSDAQEEMEYGMKENARKSINRAKWILATYVMENK